ncbi:trp operon leader peptide [Streptomyces pyxinicus]
MFAPSTPTSIRNWWWTASSAAH